MTTVKNIHANSPDVTEPEQVARRYVQLIEELGREHDNFKHGWLSAVARRLGVDQSYVSRLHSQKRVSIGNAALLKAIGRLRLSVNYFLDPAEPRSYRDYLGKQNEPSHAAWKEFLEQADDLDDAERAVLASIEFADPIVGDTNMYMSLLYFFRGYVGREEIVRSAKTNKGLERATGKAKQKRKRPVTPIDD